MTTFAISIKSGARVQKELCNITFDRSDYVHSNKNFLEIYGQSHFQVIQATNANSRRRGCVLKGWWVKSVFDLEVTRVHFRWVRDLAWFMGCSFHKIRFHDFGDFDPFSCDMLGPRVSGQYYIWKPSLHDQISCSDHDIDNIKKLQLFSIIPFIQF